MGNMLRTASARSTEEVLTVDNGGTSTRMALLNSDGDLERQVSYATPSDYESAIELYGVNAERILDGRRPKALGISIAGAVGEGEIVSAGQLEAYGWVGKPFVEDVSGVVGVSTEQIALLNDCAAGARAEQEVRELRGADMGMFAVQSTGIGNAFYNHDEIFPDEMGHEFLRGDGFKCPCGKENCMEAYAGGTGIRMNYGVAPEGIPHSDPRWLAIKTDFHEGIGNTLVRAHEEFDGSAVKILGFTGGVVENGPSMLPDLQKYLTYRFGENDAPQVDRAAFGEESGLYGAAFAARALINSRS